MNKVERDEKESEDDYFKRKIKILEKTATDDDLIIIDNFDVEFDEELENLFKCPAKFIITTRMDFRDYNYKQITIDRMSDIKDLRELFYSYNDTEYNEGETDYIEKLIEYVDRHTMTVELIAKYLKNICDEPKALYERFLEKEQTRKIEHKVMESICESLLYRKKRLEAEKQKIQVSKMQLYERHKQDEIDKEAYLSKKEDLSKKLKNTEQEIAIITDKIKENTSSGHNLNVDKLREAVTKGELVLDWINEVIDRIYVYGKDKVEIIWKFEKGNGKDG